MSRRACVLLILGCVLSGGPAWARTWTASSGEQKVEAELESYAPGRVWLRRVDGRLFEIPLADLSQADREYVAQRAREDRARILVRTQPEPGDIRYGPGRELAKLSSPHVDESSGIACSHRHPGWFWTHNDSGNDARLYLFDSQGRDFGSCRLAGTDAFDWEDIVSFQADGKSWLLVCDTGNNGLAAAVHMLHLVEEPPLDADRGATVAKIPVVQTIYFSFEDDYRDCEAVGVDPTDRTILLVSKEHGIGCTAYALAWPKKEEHPTTASVARRIARLRLPEVTAMDVSPDGRRAIVCTYGNAYEYTRGENEHWAQAFSRPPREIALPERVQGEGICYGPDGKTLYLTSEKTPTPLIEVPVVPP